MRQRGLVLLTTVIMISILTLLILSLMQSVFLYIKVNNQVLRNHELLYQLEAVAYQLGKENYTSDCLLTNENPNQILELLLSRQGCFFRAENQQYIYLVNDLGLFPCLHIRDGKEIHSSHHWLITVMSPPPQQAVLQVRISKAVQAITCQASEMRMINKGLLSWRYLPTFPSTRGLSA